MKITISLFCIIILSGCVTPPRHHDSPYEHYGPHPGVYKKNIYNPYDNFNKVEKYPILGVGNSLLLTDDGLRKIIEYNQ